MFGRRHRARPQPRPDTLSPAPQQAIDPEQLFERIRSVVNDYVGENGTWTLVRRSDDDTDSIFQHISVNVLAQAVTASILSARDAGAVPAVHDAATAPEVSSSTQAGVPLTGTERVVQELETVAVWADPVRHDPSFVNEGLVSPPSRTQPHEQIRHSA